MMKKILLLIVFLLLHSQAYAVNWCDDANNVGCFLMEDETTETDRGGNTSNDLSVSSGDTIEQSTTKKFGTYSRDFELTDTDTLEHSDGNETDINGADAKLSISMWFYLESDTGNNQYLVNKYSTVADNRQYAMVINSSDKLSLFKGDSVGSCGFQSFSGNTNINSAGTWYHLAVVYDDIKVYLYLNGSLDNGTGAPETGGICNGDASFLIGGNGGGYSDGLIDDVGIFSSDLDSTDINDIMDNGLVQAAASTRNRLMLIN